MRGETERPEWDDVELPESPALLPLAVQLAQERPPLRLVKHVPDAKNALVAEEWYSTLVAAAERSWEMERDLWLTDSIKQCEREPARQRTSVDEDLTASLAGISAEALWIPWTLGYFTGTFLFGVLDARAQLVLQQSLAPENSLPLHHALNQFDTFALRLVENTIERKWRGSRAALSQCSGDLLAKQFDAAFQKDWTDPHAFLKPVRADLVRLWPVDATWAGMVVWGSDCRTRVGTAARRWGMVTDFLRRANEVPGVGIGLERNHFWRAAGYRQPRDFQYWQSADSKATKSAAERFARLLCQPPEEFIRILRKKSLIR